MNIPLEGSPDCILFIDVLHEINDRAKLFDKFYRLLKVGGIVIVYPMHINGEEVMKIEVKNY
ncbi:methyltransferase domain-containing protein [Candidatus Bathyarchaeota archaeon]|nr:methyltransferase domain-containing protein [Candidatus Bathyarchaeota archaeon]